MKLASALSAVLILLLVPEAFAQEPNPKPTVPVPARDQEEPADPPTAEEAEGEVIRTTTRAPQKSFSTDRSVNVVDQEKVRETQASSTTDALEEEDGVFVQQTNRGAGTVILRGMIGIENLIYVDGVRFNQSTFRTGPIQYLNTLDPWGIGRLEVVRGAGSVLFGSGAMGGVVHLFPRTAPDDDITVMDARFTVETADLSTGFSMDAASRHERFWASAGMSFKNHQELRVGGNGGEDIVASNLEDGNLVGSGFREFFWRGGLGYDMSSNTNVRLNYQGGFVFDAPRTDRIGDGEIRRYDNQDDLFYGTFEHDGQGWWDTITLNASYHQSQERVDRRNCEKTTDANGNDSAVDPVACAGLESGSAEKKRINDDKVSTLGSSMVINSDFPALRLLANWGTDLYADVVTTSSRKDGAAPDFEFEAKPRGNFAENSTYWSVGSFLYLEQSPLVAGEHELVVRGGARVDSFSAFAPDVTSELGDVDYSYAGLVGSLSVSHLYSTVSNVYLSWNQGFRAPNLQETTVLGDTGNFFEVPNPDLGPERSNTFELGSKLDFSQILRGSAAVYATLFSDKITRDSTSFDGASEIDGKGVVHRVNRDTAYNYGFELEASSYPIVFDTSFYGNLAWVDGAIEADEEDSSFQAGPLHDVLASGDFYSNPRRLPPLQWLVGAKWEKWGAYGKIWAQGNLAQDKLNPSDVKDLRICEATPGVLYRDVDQDCEGSDGWTTLNVSGGIQRDVYRVDLALENLTDQRYRPHGSGFLAGGFNAMLTLSVFQ